MPQSYVCLHYHVIFSTKNRAAAITSELQPRLYDYSGGIVRSEGGILLAAGGVADHVHLLMRLTQTRAVADVLRIVKTNSSKWLSETFPTLGWPGWQTGYGAFAVSYSALEDVELYLARQPEHHRTVSFQNEYRQFLTKHALEFDERYLWD